MATTQEQALATLAELYSQNQVAACRKALARTRNVRWQDRLDVIDKLLGTFGTEAILGEWQNGYWCDIAAAYCNTGDTYRTTVIHVRGEGWNPAGRFIISSWGDWVERNERKYGLQ